MARTLWPGQDPIGKFVLNACSPERRVIGVVGDVRHLALEQRSGNEMYIPLRQCGDLPSTTWWSAPRMATAPLVAAVRDALKPLAPNLPATPFRTLQQLVDRPVSPRRFVVLMLGGFAVFALILASLGIYALISYSVNQRTQEIGIRMALGASARDVQARIVGQTLRLAAIGMAIGMAASWAARAVAERPALRRDRNRSRDVRGHAAGARHGRHAGGIRASPPRLAHRPAGRPASGVRRRSTNLRPPSDRSASAPSGSSLVELPGG